MSYYISIGTVSGPHIKIQGDTIPELAKNIFDSVDFSEELVFLVAGIIRDLHGIEENSRNDSWILESGALNGFFQEGERGSCFGKKG